MLRTVADNTRAYSAWIATELSFEDLATAGQEPDANERASSVD